MATVNIFGSIDVKGILNKFGDKLKDHYGGRDITKPHESYDEDTKKMLLKKAENNDILTIGYYSDEETIQNYTRLISGKRSTIGYLLSTRDFNNGYLTNTYNLSIRANNGDTLCWWGHSINPDSPIQAVISNIGIPAKIYHDRYGKFPQLDEKLPQPKQFTGLKNSTVGFDYVSHAVDSNNLNKGFYQESHNKFCIECDLEGNPGDVVEYDIQIKLLSKVIDYNRRHITVPIATIVIDPTVTIE